MRAELGKLGARVAADDDGSHALAQQAPTIQPLAKGRDGETEKEAELADAIAAGQSVVMDQDGTLPPYKCDGGRDRLQCQFKGLI